MALALLCSGLNKDFPNSTLKLRAFVVDHAARPGSDIEAQQVAKDVGKLSTYSPAREASDIRGDG